MKSHPLASIFPLLCEKDLTVLVDDIREHGLREPVWLYEGMILDGRNRAEACKQAGIDLQTREFVGTRREAIDFVWSMNFPRRHLDSSQAAIAGEKRNRMIVECIKMVGTIKAEAKGRQKAGKGPDGSGGRGRKKNLRKQIPEGLPAEARRANATLAKAAGTNRRYLEMAGDLLDEAPELAEKVERGELKITSAHQELKRKVKREDLAAKAAKATKENKGKRLWKIHCNDCLVKLRDIPVGSVRLIFADPPYNIGVDYGDGEDADRLDDDKYVRWVAKWIAACKRVLTADGSLWVMIGDEYAAEYFTALKAAGFTIRSWIKWYETFGVNCANNFNRCSRHIFYAVRDPKHFVFNTDAVTRPSDRQTKYADKRAASGGKIWDDVWVIPRLTGTCDERLPDFPTQYPLAIAEAIVGCASEPGDTVLDPFSGSATTGVAAVNSGRKYIGIELRERFAELSELRLKGIES